MTWTEDRVKLSSKKTAGTYADETKRKKKKRKKKSNPVKKTFAVIGTTLLSLVLIVLIVGSILAAALTVYVLQFVQNTTIDINLDSLDEESSSFIYAYDDNGGLVEMKRLSRDKDRIPVSLDEIPQYVQDAFVYTEDASFYEHSGVDWKRTFFAFVNELTHQLLGRKQGGSTITQQLIKNVSGDDAQNWDRKMREIIRAGQMEQYCTKSKILEAYLNYVGFGGRTYGIEAASLKYFGKSAKELTVAEGACLAGIPQSPNYNNPWKDEERCLERQKLVLHNMLNYGAISENEYNEAINTEVKFRSPDEVDNSYTANSNGIQNWFVDTVIEDVIHDFMDLYGIEWDEAEDRLYNGGYKVYTTCDAEMQLEIEKKYQDYRTFSSEVLNEPPYSAFVVMDYEGNILAITGNVGEKAQDNIWNYATTNMHPGSCIKPLSVYGYALEHNLINYSSIFIDSPIEIEDENDPMSTRKWPSNNNGIWSEQNVFVYQALERSLNTVPAQLAQLIGPGELVTFLQNKFQISTLNVNDANLAPMAVGALTDGLTLRELVASYQVFGNLGKYYEPTTYYYVEGPNGERVLDHAYTPIQSIGEDTAYIMNKMMQVVVDGANGTGRAAKLNNMPLAGKTGTTQNYADILFVGCTPNYVSGVWYGYGNARSTENTYYSSAQVWKNVFGDIAEEGILTEFPKCDDVAEYYYCSETGLAANGNCKIGGVGYYKSSNPPATCSQCKGSKPADEALEVDENNPVEIEPEEVTEVPEETETEE